MFLSLDKNRITQFEASVTVAVSIGLKLDG